MKKSKSPSPSKKKKEKRKISVAEKLYKEYSGLAEIMPTEFHPMKTVNGY
jgi:hypothetical protein